MKPFLSVRIARAIAVMAVVAAVVLLAAATTAWAAPPSDTVSTADIQSLLDAATPGSPVTGYFDTVLGGATLADQTPTQIPVTIKAIVPDAGPAGDLILFECDASGPITTIGGIAEGMSGSPLYVDVGAGTYELAGAVSYGDIFTTNYLGLATPIDDMIAIETSYLTATGLAPAPMATRAKLAAPVKTAVAGTLGSIVVAPSRAAAARLSHAATGPVMAPLTVIQINGLDRRSKLYQRVAASFAARGIDISPFSAGAMLGAAPPAPDAGGSLGAMYSTGDVAFGAFGTVTYVDADNNVLVAFGHPFDWLGPDSLILTSAWVQGVWSSSYTPYKVMSPGETAGEITQDRAAGIAGTLGAVPAVVPVASQASLGTVAKTQSSDVSQWIVDNPLFSGLPSAVAGAVMLKAADAFLLPGSATTTATIHVTDGVNDYQIQRDNVWSDPFDVTSFATGDIDDALSSLVPAPPGVTAKVTSIDFSADLSRTLKNATIDDVSCPGGFHTGDNTLTVSLTASDGSTVTVPVTLHLPAGFPHFGTVEVFSAVSGGGGGSFGALGAARSAAGAPLAAGPTLGDLVDSINAEPTNGDIDLSFTPDNFDVGSMDVITDVHDWVVDGDVLKDTGRLSVHAPSKVTKGKRFTISGYIVSADGDTTLTLYKRPAGNSAYTRVGAVQATATGDGSADFSRTVAGINKATSFKLVWNGDGSNLGATWTRLIRLK